MPQQRLSLETLKDLDLGVVSKTFQHHLTRAVQDCFSRPGDKSARVVEMKFKIVPDIDPTTAECETVLVDCEFQTKVPSMRSKTYRMAPSLDNRTGTVTGLLFHPDDRDDPDAQTIMDVAEGKTKKTTKTEEE